MARRPRQPRGSAAKLLRPMIPNAGLEVRYRRKLLCLVDEMHASVLHWVRAAYRAHEPMIARDEAMPAIALRAAVKAMVDKWRAKFDGAAPALADFFGKAVSKRSDDALRAILRKGGFSVRFQMTAAQRDILKATVFDNVSLIKSIPEQYLTQVEGAVMRSVQTGRDVGGLTKELQKQFGVTRRRATLIARDQNNKATSALTRARQVELQLQAVWQHSGAGWDKRPTHVKMDGKPYDPAVGMWDKAEGRYVFPGELINCKCRSRSVVPGFT